MSRWKRLEAIDRRVIFVILTLGVLAPMIFPMNLPIAVTPEVQNLYDRIEDLRPGEVIVFSGEYDPATLSEMQSMTFSVLRHAFRRNAKVIVVCLFTSGVSQVEQDLLKIADEMGKTYGKDYVYLGYKPYPAIIISAMGQDFRNPFPRDYYGTATDSLPLMKGIKNLNSVKFVIDISATSGVDFWLQYGQSRYQFPLALGVTAVMATDYYSYLQSDQIFALMGGLKGAAEYETLMKEEKGYATRAMNIQSVVHLVIVGFILVGNVAYLMSGGRIRMGGRA